MNYNYIDLKLLKNFTLLYVEDDKSTRVAIGKILSVIVKKVYITKNGKEGLEVFKQYKPDIVITDILMPQLDGISMSKEIREINQFVPIIFTTSFNESNFLLEAINMNIDRYLIKPIDVKKLNETLYRASMVVFQKKEIVERDFIIKNILLSNPTYSLIIDKKHIKKVNQDILNYLSQENSNFLIEDRGSQIDCKNISNILEEMKSKNIKEKNILLKPKEQNNNMEFLVRIYYFEISNLFLITLFEKNRIINTVWEKMVLKDGIKI